MKKQIITIYCFYRDGFRQMTWGRTLWWLILVKLFVIFVILKVDWMQSRVSIKNINILFFKRDQDMNDSHSKK